MAHGPLNFPIALFLLERVSFVVLLLAARKTELDLGLALLIKVYPQGDLGKALLL